MINNILKLIILIKWEIVMFAAGLCIKEKNQELGVLIMTTSLVIVLLHLLILKIKETKYSNFKYSNEEEANDDYENFYNLNNEINKLFKKYEKALTLHDKLQELIGVSYSIARNSNVNDGEIENCISLCYKDISLATSIKQYYSELAKINNATYYEMHYYPSFKKLAILLESQHKYEEAIRVCKIAIQLDFYDDGTEGKMYGRLSRLNKKMNKKDKKIIIIDEETGEILNK